MTERKVLTEEEWIAKRRAEAAARPLPPPLPPRKMATVKAYRQITHIYSHAVYSMAMPDPKGVELFLPPDLPDAELGARAREALGASRFIDPGHPEWDAVMRAPFTEATMRAEDQRLMEAAGVRTLKALRTGARMVTLTLQDGVISIAPWQQHRGGGWTGLDASLTLAVPKATPDEALGRAVRETLARSR